MKKYYVSLSATNLVWTGTAKDEKEALKLALEAVDNGEAEIDDDWSNDVELDIKGKITPNSDGVWIEQK